MGDHTPAGSRGNVSIGPVDASLSGTAQCDQPLDLPVFRPQTQPYLDQLPYTDHLAYPHCQQYALINSSVTGAEGNIQSSSTSWFIAEPILYSMMPGEVHPSENVCMTFTMDRPYFEERSINSDHFTQPMIYSGDQTGQVVLMNPEPEPIFVTLENASRPQNNSFIQEEVVTMLPNDCDANPDPELLYASQNASNNRTDVIVLSNQPQGACSSVSIEQRADRHRQSSVSQSVRNSHEWRSWKPCHCTKSKCLKLYCECFSSGVMCNKCNCNNCHNNTEHEAKREKAMKSCLVRNPNAFKPKIPGRNVKGWHSKGCNCKRSGCLKNYCECYEANIKCTSSCKCVGCRNYDVNLLHRSRTPTSVISSAVVKTVSECLLARAAEVEREQRCESRAQQEILNEFGLCLGQIVTAMLKNPT